MPDAAASAAGGLTPETILVLAAALVAVLVVAAAAVLVAVVIAPRRRLRQRMTALGLAGGPGRGVGVGAGLPRKAVAGAAAGGSDRQKRIQEKLQEMEQHDTPRVRRRNQMRLDLLHAGVDWSLKRYMMVMVAAGLATLLVLLALRLGLLLAVPGAVVGALGLPRAVLRLKAAYRRKSFIREFPNALDVLVRGMRSGLPVGECMAIVARESPEPVSGEFRQIVEGTRLGLELDEILQRAQERVPVPEYRFFAIVLLIQRQTGGNLAETLANLSNVLRDRKRLRDKVKAMSSEAKASAGIIGSLPFIVGGLVYLINSEYISLLFTETTGRYIILGGLAWMAVGIAVMAKMINFKM